MKELLMALNEDLIIPGETVSIDTGLIGYTVKGLPSGLKYDKTAGMITGAATKSGEYAVKFTKDVKAAALTVTLKADGATAIAGKLPNGVDAKDKAVSLKVSASGYANVGGMTAGAIIADFAPIVTVNKAKRVLSIRANLWFDRSNSHEDGAGSAVLTE